MHDWTQLPLQIHIVSRFSSLSCFSHCHLASQVAVREITEELEAARDELKDLRVRERLAREERDSARERLSDAEAAMAKKEKEHVISCQRAESRLESLQLAAEQEELECGAEVMAMVGTVS